MRKTAIFILLTFIYVNILAQNNIKFNINHKLGEEDFDFELGAQNNIKNTFDFIRVQYYISEISIIHDGGIETAVEDYWILVDASKATQENLGEYEIDNVEGISFHVGVDTAHNHLDPAGYDPSHPLAPQNPSMHWGWFSGYRFIALEGNGGTNYDQVFELHGLGDDNYFKTEIEVSALPVDNVITINIDADYTRTLENITVNGGIIVHGDSDEALMAIENFRDCVFSASNAASFVSTIKPEKFNIYPNPSHDGNAFISLESTIDNNNDEQIQEKVTLDDTPYELKYGNLPDPELPEDNPLTQQGVQLGKMLFYETMLSRDGSQSCADCHRLNDGFINGFLCG